MNRMNSRMGRIQVALLIVVSIILALADQSMSFAHNLSKAQVDIIQEKIQTSMNLSDNSSDLMGNAQKNAAISSSNFDKTGIEGFQQASALFSQAEQLFLQARDKFDDAWIDMQTGLDSNVIQSIRNGIQLHNVGVGIYNRGVQLLNNAHRTFAAAFSQSRVTDEPTTTSGTQQFTSEADTPPILMRPRSDSSPLSFPGTSSNAFPLAALIVLLGTVMTSLQAFKDEYAYEKFILHPWSIVRHGKRYYTLLTNGLIHADAMHLGINLMSFCFFAFMLERIVGHRNFLIIYFGSLVFSSFVVTVKNGNNAYYRALGASGAIAGVIFSFILYRPTSTIRFMFAPMGIPAVVFAVFYLGYSWFMAKNKYDNIGHEAHFWGALSGALITMVLDPRAVEAFRSYLNF